MNAQIPSLIADRKVCVVGSGGLIGAELTRQLRSHGACVMGWRRQDGDLRTQKAVSTLAARGPFDIVFLMAGRQGGIAEQLSDPIGFGVDNALITANCLSAFRDLGVPRLIYAASTAVYPTRDEAGLDAFTEADLGQGPPDKAHFTYSAAKLLGIRLCHAICETDGLSFTPALIGNTFGPGGTFDPSRSTLVHGMVRRAVDAHARGDQNLLVWGTGAARRDILYVQDAARALILVGLSDEERPVNIASGQSRSVREIGKQIAAAVGLDGLQFDPSKPEGVLDRPIDITRLRTLGFEPQVPFSDAIDATVDAYLAETTH